MIRFCIAIVSLFFLTPEIRSQKEGDQWIIGYIGSASPSGRNSILKLDFSNDKVTVKRMPWTNMWMRETSSMISNRNGQILLWSNGMQIFGRGGISIIDTISFDDKGIYSYWNWYNEPDFQTNGFPRRDGSIILPVPGIAHRYSVVHHTSEYNPNTLFPVTQYLETWLEFDPLDESFTVLFKDKPIDPLIRYYTGPIAVTRHANGRDWWLVMFEADQERYLSFILGSEGIHLHHIGAVDAKLRANFRQAVFSSQGDILIQLNYHYFGGMQDVFIFSFDRCTGNIEKRLTFETEAGLFSGAEISPSGQYLYVSIPNVLFQWDLWAEDIPSTKTVVDTFDGFVQPGWVSMRFGEMITAPDGRIYVIPPAASSGYMHVINRPDLPAAESRFIQHEINLTAYNGRSVPNIPNFRLGPLDGSPCDTLGLNNLPVARWRYEEDIPGWWYTIRFTDLSYFDPHTWHWDFDNGYTSSEPSPVHTFEPGLYHVCLTVSNDYATDSMCRWVNILTTSLKEEQDRLPDLSISPNPFTNDLMIRSRSGSIRPAHVTLYDLHGRAVFREQVPIPLSISMPSLLPGMYLCVIREQDGAVHSERVVKK